MILPNSDISIMDVRNITGCPSTDLGTLCAKAKTGGKNGYAFEIVENGYTMNDGNLINGAEPYYNIWSNNAAGEWYVKKPDMKLTYRIRRETPTSRNYAYQLGNFRGYNSNAPKPYIFKDGAEIYLQQSDYSIPVGITIFWEMGEIDWKKIFNSNYTDIKVYGDKTLYASRPMLQATVNIDDYNVLGHYTINAYSGDFAGCTNGDKFYFWGEIYNNSALLSNFPTTNYGVIQWAEYWKDNKLGNVSAVYSANNFNIASNYQIISPKLSDTTDSLTFQLYKNGNDKYQIDRNRCYIRCKWRDKPSWQDCPSYSIELPPDINFTRTCSCKLPMRSDKSEYIDIQLVLE